MANLVVHWEIGAKGAAKMGRYYTALFGWQIDQHAPLDYRMVNTGGESIGGGLMQTDQNTLPPYVTFYV